jgi:hypothetical protein
VVAREGTTCLVFSPGEPTNFAGRGEAGQSAVHPTASPAGKPDRATCRIDVGGFVQAKVEALSQHRTQYPITPGMFPLAMLKELLGTEYFVQAYPPKVVETDLLPGGPFMGGVRHTSASNGCRSWPFSVAVRGDRPCGRIAAGHGKPSRRLQRTSIGLQIPT